MLFEKYNPLPETLSGIVNITNSDYMGLLISASQLITDVSVLAPVMAAMLALAVLLSLCGALLFTGLLGSVADGVRLCGEFQAVGLSGFTDGYKKKFFSVLILFAVTILSFEFLILVWIISAVPLAVIGKAAEIGVLDRVAYMATLIVTMSIVYFGAMFLRIYSFSCIPAIYSNYKKSIKSGFKCAGRFFKDFLGYFLFVDVIQLIMLLLYGVADNNTVIFVARCAITAFSMMFLLFVFFYYFNRGYESGKSGYNEETIGYYDATGDYDDADEDDEADEYYEPDDYGGDDDYDENDDYGGNNDYDDYDG